MHRTWLASCYHPSCESQERCVTASCPKSGFNRISEPKDDNPLVEFRVFDCQVVTLEVIMHSFPRGPTRTVSAWYRSIKFFCGFSFEDIAGLLGISIRTAQRDWDKARILLRLDLGED